MNGLLMLITATGLAAKPPEPVTLVAESYSVRFEEPGLVRYEIVFNRSPDFLTTDPDDAQADSFQIYLDTQEGNHGLNGTSPLPWESVVRGEEIHASGDIRIRDHITGPSTAPGSGGWGPVAGSVPYQLRGTTLTFTAPFAIQNTATGKFAYVIELYRYGAWTGATYDGASEQIRRPGTLTDRAPQDR